TGSADFPTTPGAFDTTYNGNGDAFVTKLDPTGSMLIYSTYLGGTNVEVGNDIVVDAGGNAYVTGLTFSTNFPTTPGAFDTTYNGSGDVFVTKLNPTGSTLIYSTYLGGGTSTEQGEGIAVDAGGNAYVTGFTHSTDFPTTPGAFDTTLSGFVDAFVTKLNPTGSMLIYSTYLGGTDSDRGFGIALDAGGNAYVTGFTESANFPTTPGAFDTTYNGSGDVFVTKLNPTGSTLIYSTYLGGTNEEGGSGIAVDAGGNAYITGFTNSTDFPTTPGAFDTTLNGNSDAFVTKLGTVLAPTITCTTNITVSNDPGFCGAIVNYPTPTVTDECPLGFTVSCTPASGSFFPVGTTTVTCTVTDPCGGTATCSFIVTVVDSEPPTVVCPDNITQENDPGECGAVVYYPSPTVSDNCPGVVHFCTHPSGLFFPIGTTPVTCTARDRSGNITSCSFTVTVIDTNPRCKPCCKPSTKPHCKPHRKRCCQPPTKPRCKPRYKSSTKSRCKPD
ncbi:HYR domain-containing protein, partial [Priestia endophytica]|uniref:HYR domain-containing protein n=1 Tax=Priestia endophytica TaxID=135735 RepID=UPI00203C1970